MSNLLSQVSELAADCCLVCDGVYGKRWIIFLEWDMNLSSAFLSKEVENISEQNVII